MTGSPLCTYWSTADKTEHHLFMWDNIEILAESNKIDYKKMEVTLNFTTCEILFGIPFHGDINLFIVNSVIIHGILKW